MLRGRNFAGQSVWTLGLIFSASAIAQTASVSFHVGFSGHVSCNQPFQLKDAPIRGDGTGTLSGNGSVSADFTETSFGVLSTTIHFDNRLGAKPTVVPGGTSQVRVAGSHSLMLIWDLPNDQLITHISVSGQSCLVHFESRLKRGKNQYTLFDGSKFHYCDRPQIEQTSCSVR